MQTHYLSRRLWVACLLLACGWFLSSCQSVAPTTSHLNQKTISLEDLRKRLIFRQAGITDLKSFVNTTLKTQERKQSFRQALVVRQPDSLRIDTLSPLGQPLGVYIFNGKNIEGQRSIMYDPSSNRIFLGKEVQKTFAKTLGMDLNLADFTSVFYGGIPRLKTLKMTGGALSEEGDVYSLTAIDPADQSRMGIEIDAYSLLPKQITRTLPGGKTIRVKWGDYREIKGRDFPHRIVLELPAQGQSLTLVYTAPIINSGISDDSFQLSPASSQQSLLQK